MEESDIQQLPQGSNASNQSLPPALQPAVNSESQEPITNGPPNTANQSMPVPDYFHPEVDLPAWSDIPAELAKMRANLDQQDRALLELRGQELSPAEGTPTEDGSLEVREATLHFNYRKWVEQQLQKRYDVYLAAKMAAAEAALNMGVNDVVPLISREEFDVVFETYCIKRDITLDKEYFDVGDQVVHLYSLHCEVMNAGGMGKVNTEGLWPIIAQRLLIDGPQPDTELAQSEGPPAESNTEPAASGNVSAESDAAPTKAGVLEDIYRRYLMDFENWCVAQRLESRVHELQECEVAKATLPPGPPMSFYVPLASLSPQELNARNLAPSHHTYLLHNRAYFQRLLIEQMGSAPATSDINPQHQAESASVENTVGGVQDTEGAGQTPREHPPAFSPLDSLREFLVNYQELQEAIHDATESGTIVVGHLAHKLLTREDLLNGISMLRTQIEQEEGNYICLAQELDAARGTPAEAPALVKVKDTQEKISRWKENLKCLVEIFHNFEARTIVVAISHSGLPHDLVMRTRLGIPGQPRQPLTAQELVSRVTTLRTEIEQGESTVADLIVSLRSLKDTAMGSAFQDELKEEQTLNDLRKESQQRLMVMLQNYPKAQQVAAAAAIASGGDPNPGSAAGMDPAAWPPQQAVPGLAHRLLTIEDLISRIAVLRTQIEHGEQTLLALLQALSAARDTPAEGPALQKVKEAQALNAQRKGYRERLMVMHQFYRKTQQVAAAAAVASGGGPNPGGADGMQPTAWNNPAAFDAARNQPGQAPNQVQPNPIPASPSLSQLHSQTGYLGFVPPRTQAPPQQSGSPFNGNAQTPTGQPFTFPDSAQSLIPGPSQLNLTGNMPDQAGGMMHFNGNMTMPPVPPLDKARFDNGFRSFCLKRNVKPDSRTLTIDNRTVDLHHLHCELVKEGGSGPVDQKDMWSVIGGRLGFVQFPASESEPARSSPDIAQALQNMYKLYLMTFDTWYMGQVLAKRAHEMQQMQAQTHAQTHVQAQAQVAQGQVQPFRPTPQQVNLLVQMSNLSVPELAARGTDERSIAFIEQNRAILQRQLADQKVFMMKAQGTRSEVPNSGSAGPSPPVVNPPGAFGMVQDPTNLAQQQQLFIQQSHLLHQARPIQDADMFIRKVKSDFMRDLTMPPVDIPAEQRIEYNNLLEAANRVISDADQKLPLVHIIFSSNKMHDQMKKLIANICLVQSQRNALSGSGNPRYILTYEHLESIMMECQRIMEVFSVQFSAARDRSQQDPLRFMRPMTHQIQLLALLSDLSVEELAAKGTDEASIALIESNRLNLQARLMQQKMLQPTVHQGDRTSIGTGQHVWPSQHIQTAELDIRNIKTEISQEIGSRALVDVPAEQRLEYNNVLEEAFQVITDADLKLPYVYGIFSRNRLRDQARALTVNICLVQSQRNMLLSLPTPGYILTLDNLKNIIVESTQLMSVFLAQYYSSMARMGQEICSCHQAQHGPAGPPQSAGNPLGPLGMGHNATNMATPDASPTLDIAKQLGLMELPGISNLSIQDADHFVRKAKREYNTREITRVPVDVPVDQRTEYTNLLESASQVIEDADKKLPLVQIIFSGNNFLHGEMRKLVANICLIQTQRSLLSWSATPSYIITLSRLNNILLESQRIMEIFSDRVRDKKNAQRLLESQQSQTGDGEKRQEAGKDPTQQVPELPDQ